MKNRYIFALSLFIAILLQSFTASSTRLDPNVSKMSAWRYVNPYNLYTYFHHKIVQSIADFTLKKELDLTLLALKPTGNCSLKERLDKAKLHEFLKEIAPGSSQITALTNLSEWWRHSTIVQRVLVKTNLGAKNEFLNSPESKNWLTLFTGFTDDSYIPQWIINRIQATIVARIQNNLAQPATESSRKQTNLYLAELTDKIQLMSAQEIQKQFIPPLIWEGLKKLDAAWISQQAAPQSSVEQKPITPISAEERQQIKDWLNNNPTLTKTASLALQTAAMAAKTAQEYPEQVEQIKKGAQAAWQFGKTAFNYLTEKPASLFVAVTPELLQSFTTKPSEQVTKGVKTYLIKSLEKTTYLLNILAEVRGLFASQ
jgi:hypothetical protein